MYRFDEILMDFIMDLLNLNGGKHTGQTKSLAAKIQRFSRTEIK